MPSTNSVSRVMKMPKVATPVTRQLKTSPTCSLTNQHLSQASTSREASSARRSRADNIKPSFSHKACRSEEHTSELQSLMRISYAVFCLKKQTHNLHDRST